MKLFVLMAASAALWAQDAARETDKVVLRTAGVLDLNGTAVYGVYVASKTEALRDLTITARLPRGVRYLESTETPASGTYDGVAGNVVWWHVDRVAANTLIGPLNFRVKRDGSGAQLPARVEAAVFFEGAGQLVTVEESAENLPEFAREGSITVDARGTLNDRGVNTAIPVGATGVSLFLPEGALTQRTTITIERQSVDGEPLPSGAEDTWWCGKFRIQATPPVPVLLKNIGVVIPARRLLTLGAEVRGFAAGEDGNFGAAQSKAAVRAISPGFGGGFGGGLCVSQFGQIGCVGGAQCGGFGSPPCSPFCGFGGFCGFGFGVSAAQRTAGITDGTSNTLLPYIEQDNLRQSIGSLLTSPPPITSILSPRP